MSLVISLGQGMCIHVTVYIGRVPFKEETLILIHIYRFFQNNLHSLVFVSVSFFRVLSSRWSTWAGVHWRSKHSLSCWGQSGPTVPSAYSRWRETISPAKEHSFWVRLLVSYVYNTYVLWQCTNFWVFVKMVVRVALWNIYSLVCWIPDCF